MTKLGPYQVHPIADLFPLLGDEELVALADDIKHQGLRESIVLTADGKTLVDGRNRYRACDLLAMDPNYDKLGAHYTESMIRDYIVSANLRKRDLTPSQRAMLAADLEPFYAVKAKERQLAGLKHQDIVMADPPERGLARDNAAVAAGAAGRTVSSAKAVVRDAPDLADKVRAGELALDAADKMRKQRNAAKPAPPPKPKPDRVMLTLLTHEGVEVQYPQPAKPKFNETTGDGISWAAWSWNPVTGCLHGCPYCYARDIATSERYAAAYPVGFTPLFHSERLAAPVNTVIPPGHLADPHYKRVFVCSMADLYGQWVPESWIEQVHAVMVDSPQWQYITLTKFPDRYPRLKLPAGAWIGTSVDEQKRVRIAERAFGKLPPGRRDGGDIVKWLSLEPLLTPLKFNDLSMFDWVVIGAQTETRQPDGVVPAFAPPAEWISQIIAAAKEAGCLVHCKPNLSPPPTSNAPGVVWPNEFPS